LKVDEICRAGDLFRAIDSMRRSLLRPTRKSHIEVPILAPQGWMGGWSERQGPPWRRRAGDERSRRAKSAGKYPLRSLGVSSKPSVIIWGFWTYRWCARARAPIFHEAPIRVRDIDALIA
jgi:hypothetical protein